MGERAESLADDPFALSEGADGTLSAQIAFRLATGRPDQYFMFGGSGVALAARAIERHADAPLRWLTVQFVAATLLDDKLDFTVERLGGGSVAQFALTGRVGDRVVLRAMAATGGRSGGAPDLLAKPMPDVPAPDDCALVRAHDQAERDVHQLVEIRLASGRFGIFSKAPRSADSHVRVWMRPQYGEVDAAALGLMADFVGSTLSNAIGLRGGAGSLDNTIRVVRMVPTRWVLCDIAIPAIADGIGHGRVDLFAEDGTLLTMAGQTFIARLHPSQAPPA